MRSLRNRDVLYIALVFCFSFLAVTGNVYGQAATTSISGRVSDPSGAAIPSAPVTIKNTATSATETATTDSQGRYTVPQLGIGTYDITVTKTGFQTSVRSGVTLTVGADLVIDFHLTLGQATESVNVSGEITQVETSSAAVSSLVNQTQMRELPLNGRDWEQLILLAPGVASYPVGRKQRADFGRQCLFDLGYTAGRLFQHAGWRRHAELVAAERRRRRDRHFARYRRHCRVPDADRHLRRAVCGQRRRYRRRDEIGHQRIPRLGL